MMAGGAAGIVDRSEFVRPPRLTARSRRCVARSTRWLYSSLPTVHSHVSVPYRCQSGSPPTPPAATSACLAETIVHASRESRRNCSATDLPISSDAGFIRTTRVGGLVVVPAIVGIFTVRQAADEDVPPQAVVVGIDHLREGEAAVEPLPRVVLGVVCPLKVRCG